MKRTNLTACLLAGAIALCGCGRDPSANGEKPKVLRFSAIPDQDTTAQKERYKPLEAYLAAALGVEVEFVPADSYGASVEKFENVDIHLAWFGGVTHVQARRGVEGARAIAAGAKDLQFKSYFIANAATGLKPSETFPMELAGLTFTFGSSSSTSGCVMPSHFIMEAAGESPMDFFTKKPLGFSGAHDKTAMQVQDGTFQAGALNFSTYDRLVAEGKIDPAKCVKIWETPAYADYNFTAHPELETVFGEGFIEKLQAALIGCDDPAALKSLDRARLVKVDNDTFSGIASVLEKVKFE